MTPADASAHCSSDLLRRLGFASADIFGFAVGESMLNGTVCEEGKKLAGQNVNGSQFVLDLDRCPFVKLPGGQTLENHDIGIARNQLASLVTNGAKTTYESLDDLGKGKVRFLMSILNQKAATNVLPSGEMLALTPTGKAFQIQVGGANSWELNVALDQDGTLSISGKLVNSNLTHFIVLGDDDKELYGQRQSRDQNRVQLQSEDKGGRIQPACVARLHEVRYRCRRPHDRRPERQRSAQQVPPGARRGIRVQDGQLQNHVHERCKITVV